MFSFLLIASFFFCARGEVVDVPEAGDRLDSVSYHVRTKPGGDFTYGLLPYRADLSSGRRLFRFRVQSEGDAHVALSDHDPLSSPGQRNYYDIAFGREKNRFAVIGRCGDGGCEEKTAAYLPDVTVPDERHSLWIAYTPNGGIIEVGRGVDSQPYLEWQDKSPVIVRDIGVRSGTHTKWWFHSESYFVEDCGSLLFETNRTYSYRYTLPLIPVFSAHLFDLEFDVQANADARILLASEIGLADQEPAYEIVVGTLKNTKSEIRRCNNAVECCPVVATADTPRILSTSDFSKFTIRYNSGLLQVYSGQDETPFLVHRDPFPIAVRTVAYSTGPWNGGFFRFPVQGITSGAMVLDGHRMDTYVLDFPLVPEHKSTNIDMSFLVKTKYALYITLAPVSDLRGYDGKLYEFLMGLGSSYSGIRLCRRCELVVRHNHVPFDQTEFRPFRITYRDGVVSMYEHIAEEPFLTYADPDQPLDVRSVHMWAIYMPPVPLILFSPCNFY